MHSKTFFLLFLAIMLLQACKPESIRFEPITFENPYKFNAEIEQQVQMDTVPWKYQISATDYALKGDYKIALLHWVKGSGGAIREFSPSERDSINALYTQVNAKDYIVEESKSRQVVIINEAHHSSLHRIFTRSLLQDLYDNGYKYFGLETLGNGRYTDTLLNERKHPYQHTGYYSKNPQFGDLIREALEIGFYLFPYETTNPGSNGKSREIDQARNIQQFIEEHPDGKFLIHCGFDHALEGKHGSWEKAMAGRLEEFTGIDPLTINQTLFSETGNPEYNHRLLKAIDPQVSTVLLDKDQNPYRYLRGNNWTDIAIFHPITIYENGRPDWLFFEGVKKVSLDPKEIKIEFPVIILAYKKGEAIDSAVPVDIFEVENKEQKVILALKNGKFDIVAVNPKGEAVIAELAVK